MNIELIEKIYTSTCSLVFVSESIANIIQEVDHKNLQNTLKEMNMKMQTELFDMNNLCYEILNNDEEDIISLINNFDTKNGV